MKIDKLCKLEKCVSKDKDEQQLKNLFLDVQKDHAFLCACDRKSLVRIAVDLDGGDVPGAIPPEALKTARRLADKDENFATIKAGDEKAHVENGFVSADYERLSGMKFTNLSAAFPKGKPAAQVAFNAKKLYELSQGLGTECVILEFRPNAPIVVRPNEKSEDAAVMMFLEPHKAVETGQLEIENV